MKKSYKTPLVEVHRVTTVLMSNTSIPKGGETSENLSSRYSGSIWTNGAAEDETSGNTFGW